jgi:hypothetical protein
MPEKRVASLFLEIFIITVILVTLSSIAIPYVGRMVDNGGTSGVGRVAGTEPGCSKNETLTDHSQGLIDSPDNSGTSDTAAPEP